MTTPKLNALSVSNLNVDRIRRIELSFGNSSFPLLQRGRILLASGVLNKLCGKRPKRIQFFLFNDLLVYGSQEKKRRLSKQRILELDCLLAQRVEAKPKTFQVVSPKKCLTLSTNTVQEADKWIACIRKFAARCSCPSEATSSEQNQLGTMLKTTCQLQLPPQWVPDSQHTMCMLCCQKFTIINRRHHCRKCGNLVCGGCSGHRWRLPAHEGPGLQRICSACHDRFISSRGCDQRRRLPPSSSESGSDVFSIDEGSAQLPHDLHQLGYPARIN